MASHPWLCSPVLSACAVPTVLVCQGLKSFRKRRKVRRRARTCGDVSAFPLLAAIQSGGYTIIAPWSAVRHIVGMHTWVVRRLKTHRKRSAGSARIRRNERGLAWDRRWRSVNVSSTHGSTSLVSTSLCIFCHGVLIECRSVPVPCSSHCAPYTLSLPFSHTQPRWSKLGVPETCSCIHPQCVLEVHSETRSSRTQCPSVAHGFHRLTIVRPDPATFPSAPSDVDDGTRKVTDARGERSQVVFVCILRDPLLRRSSHESCQHTAIK